MYRVGIKCPFEAAHYLAGDFGEESTPHTHTYVVEWVCETDGLDENGFAVDISLLETILHTVTDSIAGKLLNEFGYFEQRQPSVENTAEYLFGRLVKALGDPHIVIREMEVRIWESDSAWAACRRAPAC